MVNYSEFAFTDCMLRNYGWGRYRTLMHNTFKELAPTFFLHNVFKLKSTKAASYSAKGVTFFENHHQYLLTVPKVVHIICLIDYCTLYGRLFTLICLSVDLRLLLIQY